MLLIIIFKSKIRKNLNFIEVLILLLKIFIYRKKFQWKSSLFENSEKQSAWQKSVTIRQEKCYFLLNKKMILLGKKSITLRKKFWKNSQKGVTFWKKKMCYIVIYLFFGNIYIYIYIFFFSESNTFLIKSTGFLLNKSNIILSKSNTFTVKSNTFFSGRLVLIGS